MIQELLLYLDLKTVKKKKAHMTLSKAGASVHTQHYNFWYNKQICNHETFSFPHKYAETKPESTFQEKKKNW